MQEKQQRKQGARIYMWMVLMLKWGNMAIAANEHLTNPTAKLHWLLHTRQLMTEECVKRGARVYHRPLQRRGFANPACCYVMHCLLGEILTLFYCAWLILI